MGQQQLLLVILVTIIVGIATVVAINTFGTAADSANVDAVRQDIAQIAAAAQGYYMKPAMLGGGGRTFDAGGTDQDSDDADGINFRSMAFASSGVSADGLQAWNENGVYVITGRDANEFTITGHPASRLDEAPDEDVTGDDPLIAVVTSNALSWTSSN